MNSAINNSSGSAVTTAKNPTDNVFNNSLASTTARKRQNRSGSSRVQYYKILLAMLTDLTTGHMVLVVSSLHARSEIQMQLSMQFMNK